MLRSYCRISEEDAHSMPNSIEVRFGACRQIFHHFLRNGSHILFTFWTLLFTELIIYVPFGAYFALPFQTSMRFVTEWVGPPYLGIATVHWRAGPPATMLMTFPGVYSWIYAYMPLLPKTSLAIVFMCSRLNTSTISVDGGPNAEIPWQIVSKIPSAVLPWEVGWFRGACHFADDWASQLTACRSNDFPDRSDDNDTISYVSLYFYIVPPYW